MASESRIDQQRSQTPAGAGDDAELRALITEWSWCMDHSQWHTAADLLTADGVVVLPGTQMRGPDEFRAWADIRASKSDRHTMHQVSNFRIRLDGDTAHVTSMLVLYAIDADHPDVQRELVGEYRDVCVRNEDGWRFQRREVVAMC